MGVRGSRAARQQALGPPPPPPRILTFVTAQHKLELAVHRVLAARVGRDRGGGLLLPAHAHARLDPRAPPASHPRAGLQVGRLSSTHRHSCLWRCAGAPPTHLPTPPPTLSTRMYSTPPLSRRPASVLSAPSAPAVQGSRWARSAALTSACVGTRGGGGGRLPGGGLDPRTRSLLSAPCAPTLGRKGSVLEAQVQAALLCAPLAVPRLENAQVPGLHRLAHQLLPRARGEGDRVACWRGGGREGVGLHVQRGEARAAVATRPPTRALVLVGAVGVLLVGGEHLEPVVQRLGGELAELNLDASNLVVSGG